MMYLILNIAVKNNEMQIKTKKRTFTMVEILIVLAVIGLLAAMLLPAISKTRESARRDFDNGFWPTLMF